MGSLNPLVILPNAIAEAVGEARIAKGVAGSVLLGGGQFCTKPGVIFIVGDGNRAFVDSLAKQIAATTCVTMLNRALRDAFESRVAGFSKLDGVRRLLISGPSAYAGASPALFETTAEIWNNKSELREEAFGPATILIRCRDTADAVKAIATVGGSLTGTIHVGSREIASDVAAIVEALGAIAGRVVFNGYPTGVEVNHAIVHGGPYPATTDAGTTSVGTLAIHRFTRLIAFQDAPQNLLPLELRDENPLRIVRLVNGQLARDPIVPGAAR